MESTLTKQEKFKIGLTVLGIAGGVWLIDAVSKHLAITYLTGAPHHGVVVIRDFLYFVLGTNFGGSNGVPPQFMEFCLAIPAAIMFIAARWLGKRLKKGRAISLPAQIGLGLFLGGALANWSERVLHNGVTDFIYLQWVPICIFNIADICIDLGYTTLICVFVHSVMMESKRRELDVQKFVGEEI